MSTKSTFRVVGKTINAIVALNTLHAMYRASARGVYNDSPDKNEFDGSAEGYWERVAVQLEATPEEIAHAKDVPSAPTIKALERTIADLQTERAKLYDRIAALEKR